MYFVLKGLHPKFLNLPISLIFETRATMSFSFARRLIIKSVILITFPFSEIIRSPFMETRFPRINTSPDFSVTIPTVWFLNLTTGKFPHAGCAPNEEKITAHSVKAKPTRFATISFKTLARSMEKKHARRPFPTPVSRNLLLLLLFFPARRCE